MHLENAHRKVERRERGSYRNYVLNHIQQTANEIVDQHERIAQRAFGSIVSAPFSQRERSDTREERGPTGLQYSRSHRTVSSFIK